MCFAITAKSGKLRLNLTASNAHDQSNSGRGGAAAHEPSDEILTVSELRALEASNIRRALKRAGGKIYGSGGAAKLLDINSTTLASRIKRLGVEDELARS